MNAMNKGQKESQKTTRLRAEEARKAAEAVQHKIDVRNKVIGVVVVVALVGAIFGGVYWSKKGDAANTTSPSSTAALPTGVKSDTYGVSYGTGTDKVPQLQLWEDFQCSACEQVEKANGAGIRQLATQGDLRLLWRPTTILDDNLKNTASIAAASAWGCAIEAGKGPEYHDTVFANWAQEGVGYPQATLLGFGTKAGITGAAYSKFEACVKANTYNGWIANSRQAFDNAGVSSTPTGTLVFGDKSTELTNDVLYDNTKLKAAVAKIMQS
jgi:protein-disulfide isomerase